MPQQPLITLPQPQQYDPRELEAKLRQLGLEPPHPLPQPAGEETVKNFLREIFSIPNVLRVGGGLAGGLVGGVGGFFGGAGVGAIPGAIAGSAVGSGLGELGAQLYEGEGIKPGQLAGATAIGGAAGMLPGAGVAGRTLLRRALTGAGQGALLGAGGQVVATGIDEGRLPTPPEFAGAALGGGALGAGGSAILGSKMAQKPLQSLARMLGGRGQSMPTPPSPDIPPTPPFPPMSSRGAPPTGPGFEPPPIPPPTGPSLPGGIPPPPTPGAAPAPVEGGQLSLLFDDVLKARSAPSPLEAKINQDIQEIRQEAQRVVGKGVTQPVVGGKATQPVVRQSRPAQGRPLQPGETPLTPEQLSSVPPEELSAMVRRGEIEPRTGPNGEISFVLGSPAARVAGGGPTQRGKSKGRQRK